MSLRPHGISDEDARRVAAFLRIGSEDLRHRWRISSEGYFDALLLGDEVTLPMYPHSLFGDSIGTLRLVDARSYEGEPGQLCRPLAFEALVVQLKWLESMAQDLPRAAPTASMSSPELETRTHENFPTDTEAREEAKAVTSDESPVADQAAAASLCHGDLYRLERLPAASSVGHDRRVLTVASLLTIRAVQLEELVAQSGLSVAECEAALIRLKEFGALRVISPMHLAARERSRGHGTVDRTIAQAESATGIIARLRGRLGLGGR